VFLGDERPQHHQRDDDKRKFHEGILPS
jgi:hypothetical protein